MFRPLGSGDANSGLQLHGEAHHKRQLERPAPTELNYDRPPGRIPRMTGPMLNYFAGFAQHGTQQWFSGLGGCAFLPAMNLARTAMVTNRGVRSIAGYPGAGTQGAGRVRVPSVLVPRTVS